jgi:hypothetical protein
MNSVIVFVPATVTLNDIGAALEPIGHSERTPNGGLVIDRGRDRLYVGALALDDVDQSDLVQAKSTIGEVVGFVVDYSDIEAVDYHHRR